MPIKRKERQQLRLGLIITIEFLQPTNRTQSSLDVSNKRKLERQKKAQVYNKEQDRLAKIEARKKIRQERKDEMDEQMKRFKETLEIQREVENDINEDKKNGGKISGDSDNESWNGFSDEEDAENTSDVKPILKKGQTVYTDDTTVEVETLEPNDNFEYLANLNNVKLEESENVLKESITRATKYAKFLGIAGEEDKASKPKKKKKFRYLTKNERKDNQRKANANKHRGKKK